MESYHKSALVCAERDDRPPAKPDALIWKNGVRREPADSADFYRTPPCATRALLDAEPEWFRGKTIWEPACGDGMMAEVLKESCGKVLASDLHDRGYGRAGVDFLACAPKFAFDAVVTNPPFKNDMIQQFAERALSFRPETVALLARLSWLEGKRRREFFKTSGLTQVMIFSSRVDIAKSSYTFKNGGRGGVIAYAWYAWRRGHVGPPTIGWLP